MGFDSFQDSMRRTAKELPRKDALVHGALLISGEAGELADAIKKHIVYNQELDEDNVIEELGDVLWGVAYMADIIGVNLNDVAGRCVNKLARRYPERYSDKLAATRLDKK